MNALPETDDAASSQLALVDASTVASTSDLSDDMENIKIKPKKKKVLLMGKSGSGKSSMRNIIFNNVVAKDVRRLGATIDVEEKRINQDAFTQTYLTSQKSHIFSDVGVLIYVFDVESREFDGRDGQNFRDLNTYNAIIKALEEFSPEAHVFTLVHKMDLVQAEHRERVLQDKTEAIRRRSGGFQNDVKTYGTSIWDQTLYKAWGRIVHSLIPNLNVIEWYLRRLADITQAEEIVLFERVTFLTVTSVTSEIGKRNPYTDRFERLSNIIKTFKNSLANFSGALAEAPQFAEHVIKTPRFSLILALFTPNTYVLVVIPPGEAELQCTRINLLAARDEFKELDGIVEGSEPDPEAEKV
ncbi:GTP-binding protein gtr1 [Pseudocyphellaria aurata]|nr:GTP-binding protein gtr1 [Pseudocyphellaria aurata]